VQITRRQLGQIIREEAARLQEAPRTNKRAGLAPPAKWLQPGEKRGKPPWAGKSGGGGPTSPTELRRNREYAELGGPAGRSLEDIGSFEAAQGGDEMRNFADALEEHRDRLEGISGRKVTALRKKIEAAMKTLRELAKEWDGLLLGPDDEG
jgi:hypothetical protein